MVAFLPTTVGGQYSETQASTYSPELEVSTSSPSQTQPARQVKAVNPRYPGPSVPPPSLSKEEVKQLILHAFPDAPIMVKVAECESELLPHADRAGLHVDVGLFQINQVHLSRLSELGLDRWDPVDNITYARMLYDEAGLTPWSMSKYCWS